MDKTKSTGNGLEISSGDAESIVAVAARSLLATPQAGSYACLLVDPPWRFRTYGVQGPDSRVPERHYRTMALDEIKALPVKTVAARDCHLFLWTTSPHLPQALDVMAAWGFRFSTVAFAWAKVIRRHGSTPLFLMSDDWHMGTGLTTRKNIELVLLGRRGSPKRLSKGVRELVVAPVREHSRKPDEVAERIIQYAPGPRLEMFAREVRNGFDPWGDEVGKFNGA